MSISLNAMALELNYWGGVPGRVDYELAVLRAALEESQSSDVVQVNLVKRSLGSLRGRQEVARGELVNVYASGYRVDELVSGGQLIALPVPVLNGLLGYRQLLIKRDNFDNYKRITTLAQLQQLTIGQGSGWLDVQVYEFNQVPVDDSGRYGVLLGMLARGRFDALALAIIEAEPVLAGSGFSQALVVLPNLVVYYPQPLIFYVSGNAPQLAKKLQAGMALLQSSGKLEELFQQHFASTLARLRKGTHKVIVLEHPQSELTLGLDKPLFMPSNTE
ncbi:transporter substrate-binding domain-containing protein [Gilvimarinus chinensis]|uniref:transporter substrate-binding domain-containing protein n=1 Tax=Gilvimarinus chinensis TaxID=396005 RepID=UPI0003663E3C|nr:transporter substrate-binding domain-containing protein [Gilvimarinus chinensis]